MASLDKYLPSADRASIIECYNTRQNDDICVANVNRPYRFDSLNL